VVSLVLLACGIWGAAGRADASVETEGPPAPPATSVTPPGPRPLPAIPHGGRVVLVKVDGTIDLGLAPFLEHAMSGLGAKDLFVLDINTFGGRVDAAVVIRDALLHTKARTVCWANPRAISAGALISLACDVIAVADGASLGAATPIQIGEDGKAKSVEAKMISYMRAEMRTTAEAKGRNGLIAEAMVDAEIEVPGLDDKTKLLTLDGKQAIAWGIAELTAADEPSLWKQLGVDIAHIRVERPQISWAERLARLLSDPTLSGLLMSLGMLGILIELYAPGHMVALTAGLSCLALFFFGHYVVLLAGWEEIVMFVVGAGLIAFEIMAPGHIVPGVIGVLLILAALVLALVNLDAVPLGVAWNQGWVQHALASVFGSLLVTAACTWGLMKLLPHTRLGRPLVLDAALESGVARAARLLADVPAGARGVAATDLRPMGKASFGERKLDVVLESGHVGQGGAVEVVRVDGGRLVVRALEPGASS
jgi:membrane-bound serine protease (ClpP class)